MKTQDQALKVAKAAVEQLPLKQQRQLTEWLLAATVLKEDITILYLQRLSSQKQARLAKLMDKNNEGQLSRKEQLELKRLGSEIDQILLANSHVLANALRPELFDQRDRLIKRRFQHALKACNIAKGNRRKYVDARTGKRTPLFNPRINVWEEHFRWSHDWKRLIGRTLIGRATIVALDMNAKLLQQARPYWRVVGLIP